MATKADCTCPDPDGGAFDVDCPAHIVVAWDEAEAEAAVVAQRRYDAERN